MLPALSNLDCALCFRSVPSSCSCEFALLPSSHDPCPPAQQHHHVSPQYVSQTCGNCSLHRWGLAWQKPTSPFPYGRCGEQKGYFPLSLPCSHSSYGIWGSPPASGCGVRLWWIDPAFCYCLSCPVAVCVGLFFDGWLIRKIIICKLWVNQTIGLSCREMESPSSAAVCSLLTNTGVFPG